jgi:hypothetical protein
MVTNVTTSTDDDRYHYDGEYNTWLENVQQRFEWNAKGSKLFQVNCPNLYDRHFLGWVDDFKTHDCRACRNFVNTYGTLVTIGENGVLQSVLWDESDAPPKYLEAVKKTTLAVERAPVVSVFYTSESVWGKPQTGAWAHLAVRATPEHVWKSKTLSASQKMAEVTSDYQTLSRALAKYSLSTIGTAVSLLKSEALYRSEAVLGNAEWLFKIQDKRTQSNNQKSINQLVWRATASAPTGFCHVGSSMIGTLLDDLQSGSFSFDQVKRRFDEKMNPLQYRRPQVAPKAGNVAQAEKLVAQLGIESALARRWARREEVVPVWLAYPTARPAASRTGVFKDVATQVSAYQQSSERMRLRVQNITWEKFAREILPEASKIELHVETRKMNFCALVTQADPTAPPILQWDFEDTRNPVSWYVYGGKDINGHYTSGSLYRQWNVNPGWVTVPAITYQPNMWFGDRTPHHGKGVLFILEGCRDLEGRTAGLGLFPQILKSELHGVAATIEAYSRRGVITGVSNASGILIQDKSVPGTRVRVFRPGIEAEYIIDRWN